MTLALVLLAGAALIGVAVDVLRAVACDVPDEVSHRRLLTELRRQP